MHSSFVFITLLVLSTFRLQAQGFYFPPGSGTTWDTLSPASLGWCSNQIDSLYDYLDANDTKAFILVKDGKIVLEKYFGTFTEDSLWYWASAGKTLTAFLVGIAQQEGFLSLSDPVSQYLGQGWSSCSAQQENNITIKNQLCMTTGLDDAVANQDCWDDTCLIYLTDPGTRWAYHNAPYTLLDQVIQQATALSLNSFLTSRVRLPTGMDGFYFQIDYNNVFFSKARSMARFSSLLMNRGIWNTDTILSDSIYFNDMTHSSNALNQSYGYLTWLNGQTSFMIPQSQLVFPGMIMPHALADMYAALGKNGQIINCSPSTGLAWIRMGNPPGTTSNVPIIFNDEIWQYINSFPCMPLHLQSSDKPFVQIVPNPVQDVLSLTDVQDFPIKFSIIDARGALLLSGETSTPIIDVTQLRQGIYFLSIHKNEQAVFYSRFVKF